VSGQSGEAGRYHPRSGEATGWDGPAAPDGGDTLALPIPADRPSSGADSPGDLRRILDELDRLNDEMRRRPPAGSPVPAAAPVEPAAPAEWDEGTEPIPEGSPYLDERLSLASAAMTELGREIRDLGERCQRLQGVAERLEREIGNATLESGFLRSAEDLPEPHVRTATAPTGSPRPAPAEPTPYSEFTAARYQTTIGGLRARRRRLAWWTLLLAAGISGVLVYLAVIAHEPMPPIWIAVLPVVWMIPVPFFVISFVSTQRVLRRDRLDLAGEP
jgi:hypothetical protein